MKIFTAHWSTRLVVTSAATTALCLGIAGTIVRTGDAAWWAWLAPILLVLGCSLLTIRGYAILPSAILVRRLFWTTCLPRAGLESASFEPHVMSGSLRVGNGGLFSFTGFYRNRRLGWYRAFVTDPARTVVLRYPDRTVVVSPGNPVAFAHELFAI
jgi:lysylphosphatidylglycerol synthetase-like protein (DUF2156 family)